MTATFSAPKSVRLQIGVFGRRNVGKSSTLNVLTRQNFAIVSDAPGTTTDPVEKAMELAVHGMIPDTTIGRAARIRLRVYAGADYKQVAQKPETFEF